MFLYINNDPKKFILASKNLNTKDINLTKQVKDSNNEKYSTLKNNIVEDIRKWKDTTCFPIGKTNSARMAILPKNI